jgi:hypothetical protein
MRLHLKIEPEEQDKITHVFFKASIFHTAQFKMMSEIFPQFTLTFNTRHPAPSIRSNLQVGKTIDQSLFWKLGIWWRSLLKGSYLFYFEPEFDDIKAHFNPCFNMSIEEFYLRWHCIFCKSYFQCSGFVDCILGHHHVIISSRTYCVDSSAFRLLRLRVRNRFSSLASKPFRHG